MVIALVRRGNRGLGFHKEDEWRVETSEGNFAGSVRKISGQGPVSCPHFPRGTASYIPEVIVRIGCAEVPLFEAEATARAIIAAARGPVPPALTYTLPGGATVTAEEAQKFLEWFETFKALALQSFAHKNG